MIRFLHTSDWQLGMTRKFLAEGAQERFAAKLLVCPFEEVGALTYRRLNHLPGFVGGELPIRLALGRHIQGTERGEFSPVFYSK